MYVSQRIKQGKFWFFVKLFIKQKTRATLLHLAGVKNQTIEYNINNTLSNSANIINEFHKLYYNNKDRTHYNTYWMGAQVFKCPLDLWVYHEIIYRLKPDLIIETGTNRGGSALFIAHLFDLLGNGKLITIDIIPQPNLPQHNRIEFFVGDSTSDSTFQHIQGRIQEAAEVLGREPVVLAILDSNHEKNHVLKEMQRYSKLVSTGSYLIVEDSNLNGNPVWPEFGSGPMEAIQEFLREHQNFSIDRDAEKYFLTFNPSGYLKKVSI